MSQKERMTENQYIYILGGAYNVPQTPAVPMAVRVIGALGEVRRVLGRLGRVSVSCLDESSHGGAVAVLGALGPSGWTCLTANNTSAGGLGCGTTDGVF